MIYALPIATLLQNAPENANRPIPLSEILNHLLPLWGTDPNYKNYGIAFFALIIAIITLIVTIQTYFFSKKTATNVERISKRTQIALFNDQIRHLYRNLVCTLAFSFKQLPSLAKGNIAENIRNKQIDDPHSFYLSEEHLLKLKMLPEDIIKLEKYNNNSFIYKQMHELKLLMRNYDTEIEVTLKHCTTPHVAAHILAKDFTDTLAFKPLYLIKHIIEIETSMFNDKHEQKIKQKKEATVIMLAEHLNKLEENKAKIEGLSPAMAEAFLNAIQEIIARSFVIFNNLYRQNPEEDSSACHIYQEEFLSPRNPYLREDTREFLRQTLEADSDNLPGLLQALSWRTLFSRETWSFEEIFPVMLTVDTLIEYGKIRTIDFPPDRS